MLLTKTFRSSTFRRALIWIAIFGSIEVALIGYVSWSAASLCDRPDETIATEHARLLQIYADTGRAGLVAEIARRVANDRSHKALYVLTDPSSAVAVGNLEGWIAAPVSISGRGEVTSPCAKVDATPQSLLRTSFEKLSDGSRLLVGTDVEDLDQFAKKINTALGLGIALIFVLAGLASVTVTRRTVGRIEAVNATSREIMRSGLGRRIPLHGTHDECDDLAGNLNSMLDRIEELMTEVRQFTDNVAHELRTPLTRMRSRLEKACSWGADGTHQPVIEQTLIDLDAVLRTFTSLTRISQLEASERTAGFSDIDLTEIAREAVELFEAAAEQRGANIEAVTDRKIRIIGDRDLLFEALANLLDNAIKHGREAGLIRVTVGETEGGVFVSVTDDGPGIPAEECGRVLKRFHRLERSRRTPGSGLGLSLVAAVARLHGAQIKMLDRRPGLEFQLFFQRAAPCAPGTPDLA